MKQSFQQDHDETLFRHAQINSKAKKCKAMIISNWRTSNYLLLTFIAITIVKSPSKNILASPLIRNSTGQIIINTVATKAGQRLSIFQPVTHLLTTLCLVTINKGQVTQRVVDICNELQEEVVEAGNITIFEIHLDRDMVRNGVGYGPNGPNRW